MITFSLYASVFLSVWLHLKGKFYIYIYYIFIFTLYIYYFLFLYYIYIFKLYILYFYFLFFLESGTGSLLVRARSQQRLCPGDWPKGMGDIGKVTKRIIKIKKENKRINWSLALEWVSWFLEWINPINFFLAFVTFKKYLNFNSNAWYIGHTTI